MVQCDDGRQSENDGGAHPHSHGSIGAQQPSCSAIVAQSLVPAGPYRVQTIRIAPLIVRILRKPIGTTKDRDALESDKLSSSVVTKSALELRSPSSREGLGKLPAVEDVSSSACAEGCGDKDQRRLDRQFDRLNRHLPQVVGERLLWLRKPSSRWVRLPIAILLIVASVFSFLPVLGLWMLPLGLMLLAATSIS